MSTEIEVLKTLIEVIRDNVTDFAGDKGYVKEYEGEYDPEHQWLEDYPTCLYEPSGSDATVFTRDSRAVNYEHGFRVFVASKKPLSGEPSEGVAGTLSRIKDTLNGLKITLDSGKNFVVRLGKSGYYGKEKEVIIYLLNILVI